MVMRWVMQSHKKLTEFKKHKQDKGQLIKNRIFRDVEDIKRLDRHVQEFESAIKKDIKEHDNKRLVIHAREFEHEIHEELAKLIDLSKQDLMLYMRLFKKLQQLKKTLKKMGVADSRYERIAEAEYRYAELISTSMDRKLDSLYKLFKRMRQ